MNERPPGAVLRIIDANANRAREALRVMEDYARFVLNAQAVSADLKQLRHDLTEAIGSLLSDGIVFRNTEGDVGTSNKTTSELSRDSAAHVVTAAGKRLGEALRSLEEFTKTLSPASAARIESIRYRFYVVEQTIALTLRPRRFDGVRLYVLITEAHCLGRPWQEVALQAIAGGADCLQLREKTLSGGECLRRAREFVGICRNANVVSIINDRVDVALAAEADGVHVGQEDLPVREVRRIMGRDKLIGVSTHALEQARQAVLDGADYIGVGTVYRSGTKTRDFIAGPGYAQEIAREISIPAVAIGGITPQNVDEVIATGIRAIAVTASVTEQVDVAAAAAALKSKLTAHE